jgi:hypothetical protein
MARLDEIRAARRQLEDPRNASAAEIDRRVREQPVITALLHSVDGNEISGVDAALAEAYHLLAATGDKTVDLILRADHHTRAYFQVPNLGFRLPANDFGHRSMAMVLRPVPAIACVLAFSARPENSFNFED